MKKNHLLLYSAVILSMIFLSGCARVYTVTVDSISSADGTQGKNYVLISGNKNIAADNLQFREFAGYVAKALALQGYNMVDNPKQADIELYLSYGIGEPENHVYSYSQPVWGETGGQTSTISNVQTSGDNTTYSSTTTYTPDYGVTGYTDKTDTYVTYKKYIILDAYDMKVHQQNNNLRQVWKTSISNNGKASDLRKVFPALIAAAEDYLGKNTGEELQLEIPADSEKIKNIRGLK